MSSLLAPLTRRRAACADGAAGGCGRGRTGCLRARCFGSHLTSPGIHGKQHASALLLAPLKQGISQVLLDTLTVLRTAAPAAAAALSAPLLALLPGLAAAVGHARCVVRAAAARTIAALAAALPDVILPSLLRCFLIFCNLCM